MKGTHVVDILLALLILALKSRPNLDVSKFWSNSRLNKVGWRARPSKLKDKQQAQTRLELRTGDIPVETTRERFHCTVDDRNRLVFCQYTETYQTIIRYSVFVLDPRRGSCLERTDKCSI